MLLAVDVGNTNIVLGVLDDEKMVCSGRLSTNVNETEIEYSMKLKTFLEVNGVKGIDGAIISSVVPALVRTLMKSVKLVCAVDAVVVGKKIKTGLNIKLDNPAEMGADIVVGDVAVIIKDAANGVALQGWTDSVGTEAYNKALSQRRAESVKAYLVQEGLDAGKIEAKGMGKSFKYDNSNADGRYLNRRVEVLVK